MELVQSRSCHRLVSNRWPLRLAKGCRICKLIALAVKRFCEHQRIVYRDIYLVHHEDASNTTYEYYELKLYQGSQQEPQFMRFYPNEAFLREHEQRYACTKDLSAKSQQNRRLSSARAWLDKCSREHERCREAAKSLLPKRLLYLDSANKRAILTNTSGVVEPISYACLSHCWGQVHPVQTVQNNLSSLTTTGLYFDDLPPTFRDAVESCLSLQLQYIWIDSLCIVQNDKEDWLQEAQRMASIYSSAVVTIAAARAPDCQEGFLSRPYKNDIIQIDDRLAGSGFIVGVTAGEVSGGRSLVVWARQPPLISRAWTLQESLLSPRTLIFGFEELSWECLEMAQCECGSCELESENGQSKYESKLQLFNQLDTFVSAKLTDLDPSQTRGFYLFWMGLVSNYVSRRITFDADRLVALAGIMNLVEQRTGQRCHAGHWAGHFLDSLLWSTDRGRRPATSRAPSWSWASVETPRLKVWDLDKTQHARTLTYSSPLSPTLVSVNCPSIGLISNKDQHGTSNDPDPTDPKNDFVTPGALILDAWVIETRLTPKADWQESRDGLATRWRCSCFAQATVLLDDRDLWRTRNAFYDITLVLMRQQREQRDRKSNGLLFLVCIKEDLGEDACLTRIGMGEQISDEGDLTAVKKRVEIR